jgi:succinate dehydrogenase / fumarate reductase cytochrome b subunit
MSLLGTTMGKKVVMAATGVILVLYVVVHMLGNLQVFAGPERLNDYAHALKGMPVILWTARVILFAAVMLHIVLGIQLYLRSRRSRPRDYLQRTYTETTLSSRSMILTGPLIGAYVVYHVLDQTVGILHPAFSPQDIYGNVVIGFSALDTSALYIGAMVLLGLHLKHGVWSMFQTSGLNTPRYDAPIRSMSVAVAIIVALGFISVPVAVLAGIVQ